MTSAVFRLYSLCESDDDICNGSEVSTLKGSAFKVSSFARLQADGENRSVNTATIIDDENFKGKSYCSDSDDLEFDDDYEPTVKKPPSVTKLCRIDLSPETELKKKEVYDKWVNSVISREKEKKRKEKERLKAEVESRRAIEETRKLRSEEKVKQWMRSKEIEAEQKRLQLIQLTKAAKEDDIKPKEFKRAINFQDWLIKKNEDYVRQKKEQTDKKLEIEKTKKIHQNCRKVVSLASFEKWVKTASSKAKPVPLNQGLNSLRGSTTKIYVNPEPWKYDN